MKEMEVPASLNLSVVFLIFILIMYNFMPFATVQVMCGKI